MMIGAPRAILAVILLLVSQMAFAMPGGEPLNDDPFFSPGTNGGCPQMLIYPCINGRSRNCYLDEIVYHADGTQSCNYQCTYVNCYAT